MSNAQAFQDLLASDKPLLALAPMQDVTDLPFWKLMASYGGPDIYFTEYFRVYDGSRLEKPILRSIVENPTGRPAIAQMIGNHIPSLVRTAVELQEHAVAAIDLNLGCPAPVVYKKCAGGGLLRDLQKVDAILGALRDAVSIPFTVKTRLGFDSPAIFDELLRVFSRHELDLVTVHGRTVKEAYRSEVHYDFIAKAVAELSCPVLANGNIYSAQKAHDVLSITGARGLMIGRGAIRNPWVFTQIRQFQAGEPLTSIKGKDVLAYIHALYAATRPSDISGKVQVQKMKKYLNFIGLGVEPTGEFLHRIRRVDNEEDFFKICSDYLDHDNSLTLDPLAIPFAQTDVMAGEHL
ncbi:MAG: tRNA-dihydrouridine synthase family protein [Chthoniobacterales bacterium]